MDSDVDRAGLRAAHAAWAASWAPGAATFVVLATLSTFCLVLTMDRTLNAYDEGIILVGATRVMAGAIPHRDFYVNYGPAQFYILAGLFKLFGPSVLIERAWDTACRVACVLLTCVGVGHLAPRAFALAAAMTALVWLARFGFYGYPVFPALALALASFASLVPALSGHGSARRLVTAGLLAGGVTLFRYDVGVAVAGIEGLVLLSGTWFAPRARADQGLAMLRGGAWLTLGFALLVLPVLAVAFVLGALPDLVFDVVTFPARFYVPTRSLPFPGPTKLLHETGQIAVYMPLVIAAAACPALLALWRTRRQDAWGFGLLLAFMLVFYLKGSVRVSVIQLSMSIVAAIALAAILAQPIRRRGPLGRAAAGIAVAVLAFFTLISLRNDMRLASLNIAWLRHDGGCGEPGPLACFQPPDGMIQAAGFVRARTAPGEPVFVGLTRTDKVFVNDVMLYFAMDRPPATKFYHYDPGLQTSAPIQQQIVAELRRVRPRYIVLEANVAHPDEPNDSARSSGVTLLDDFIRQAYHPVATFAPDTVLERNT